MYCIQDCENCEIPLNLHIVRRPQEEKVLKNKLKTLYFQFWMIAITEMNCI